MPPRKTTSKPAARTRVASAAVKKPAAAPAKRITRAVVKTAPVAKPKSTAAKPAPRAKPAKVVPVAKAKPAVPAPVEAGPAPVAPARPSALFQDDFWLRELAGAVDSELSEFSRRLDPLFEEIKADIRREIETLREVAARGVAGRGAHFSGLTSLALASEMEKLARRLMRFREDGSMDLESLQKLVTRLDKSRKRLED